MVLQGVIDAIEHILLKKFFLRRTVLEIFTESRRIDPENFQKLNFPFFNLEYLKKVCRRKNFFLQKMLRDINNPL